MPCSKRALVFLVIAMTVPEPAAADSVERVVDLVPGPEAGVGSFEVAALGDGVVFVGRDSGGVDRLWEYDGVALPALVPGQPDNAAWPMRLARWHDEVFFVSNVSGGIWRYDGVVAPSQGVPAAQVGFPLALTPFTVPAAFDRLCFNATTGSTGAELSCWDGDQAPAVYDLVAGPTSSHPGEFLQFGSALFFAAQDPVHGRELWRFNGVNPPALFADVRTNGTSEPHHLVVAQGRLFFHARDNAGLNRVWSTTGSSAPTVISPYFVSSGGSAIGVFRGELILRGYDELIGGAHGLWRYDGSLLRRIPPGDLADYGFGKPTVHQGSLYWWAGCGCSGNDLVRWTGVGAPALVTDEFQDLDMVTNGLLSADGRLFFTATDAEAGDELWEHVSSLVFADGFETATTGWWSSSAP